MAALYRTKTFIIIIIDYVHLPRVSAVILNLSTAKENHRGKGLLFSYSPQALYVDLVLTFGVLPGLSLRLWRICMSTMD
jgi:hypothetical protein